MENIKNNSKIKTMIINALLLSVLIVCSQIIIPMPIGVPFTLQTLAIAVLAYLLPLKNSLIVLSTYLMAGFLGLPVFSGFTGGPSKFFAASTGYLLGFLPMIILLHFSKKNIKKHKLIAVIFGLLGLLSCHLIGISWLMYILHLDFVKAALLGSVPYLIKDIVSVCFGAIIAMKIEKILK